MRALTDLEFDILNTLYFVEPFEKVLEETGMPEAQVKDGLRFLIDKKLVSPMKWDEAKGAYVRSIIYDADDMRAYRYLATRDGLIAHNSR